MYSVSNHAPYEVPDQSGKLAVVTGANSGLGLETAARLAGAGAKVVIGVRSTDKGETARAAITARHPGADVEVRRLDLAELGSVEEFAGGLIAERTPLDILVNNAGVMMVPTRMTTADGFEMQLGTNFLGPFALTNRLIPLMLEAPAARVVALGSLAARIGRIRLDDLQSERSYNPRRAYAQSKLADVLMARHLAGIADARGWKLISNSAHPGSTHTNLQTSGPNLGSGGSRKAFGFVMRLPGMAQMPDQGAEPALFAATSPEARNGAHYGPGGFIELTGPPRQARVNGHMADRALAAELWSSAERLTGTAPPPESA